MKRSEKEVSDQFARLESGKFLKDRKRPRSYDSLRLAVGMPPVRVDGVQEDHHRRQLLSAVCIHVGVPFNGVGELPSARICSEKEEENSESFTGLGSGKFVINGVENGEDVLVLEMPSSMITSRNQYDQGMVLDLIKFPELFIPSIWLIDPWVWYEASDVAEFVLSGKMLIGCLASLVSDGECGPMTCEHCVNCECRVGRHVWSRRLDGVSHRLMEKERILSTRIFIVVIHVERFLEWIQTRTSVLLRGE